MAAVTWGGGDEGGDGGGGEWTAATQKEGGGRQQCRRWAGEGGGAGGEAACGGGGKRGLHARGQKWNTMSQIEGWTRGLGGGRTDDRQNNVPSFLVTSFFLE
jgi:hypothetical protein